MTSCFSSVRLALPLAMSLLIVLLLPAQAQAHNLVADLFEAIHHTQLDKPDSYFWAPDEIAVASAHQQSSKSSPVDCAAPLSGQVHGVALYQGLPFDYSIDLDSGQLDIVYGGQQWSVKRDELIKDHGLEWVLPCVTPVTALICMGGGAGAGAYCVFRVRACEASAANCECGVHFIDCGVCGEGRGVQCMPCIDWNDDLRIPRDLFNPNDPRDLFRLWPF